MLATWELKKKKSWTNKCEEVSKQNKSQKI